MTAFTCVFCHYKQLQYAVILNNLSGHDILLHCFGCFATLRVLTLQATQPRYSEPWGKEHLICGCFVIIKE